MPWELWNDNSMENYGSICNKPCPGIFMLYVDLYVHDIIYDYEFGKYMAKRLQRNMALRC